MPGPWNLVETHREKKARRATHSTEHTQLSATPEHTQLLGTATSSIDIESAQLPSVGMPHCACPIEKDRSATSSVSSAVRLSNLSIGATPFMSSNGSVDLF